MPSGIPVATVAIDGAENAAILAAQVLAVSDAALAGRLEMRRQMRQAAEEKDRKVRANLRRNNREDGQNGKDGSFHEGKKKVYATDDLNLVIVSYKDDATAFNGLKKGTISGKGVINNQMSNLLMQMLEKNGVPTHFVKELSERETLVRKVEIVPLEVIVRNLSAGSFAKRYGVEEGIVFAEPTLEFSYKNDDLGDPLLNTSHALALGLATHGGTRIQELALKSSTSCSRRGSRA